MATSYNKLSIQDLSKAVGRSVRRIYTWLESGCPRNRDGSFNLAKVLSWAIKHVRPSGGIIPDHIQQRHEYHNRLAKARAQREELFLAEESGELVPRKDVERKWQKQITDARNAFHQIPIELSLLLGDEELRELVANEAQRLVNDALRTLSSKNDT